MDHYRQKNETPDLLTVISVVMVLWGCVAPGTHARSLNVPDSLRPRGLRPLQASISPQGSPSEYQEWAAHFPSQKSSPLGIKPTSLKSPTLAKRVLYPLCQSYSGTSGLLSGAGHSRAAEEARAAPVSSGHLVRFCRPLTPSVCSVLPAGINEAAERHLGFS